MEFWIVALLALSAINQVNAARILARIERRLDQPERPVLTPKFSLTTPEKET